MARKTLLIAGITAAAAIGGASVGAASSTPGDDQPLSGAQVVTVEGQDDDSGQPVSAADRDKAGQAALAKVGQGTVGEVERESEGGSAYEVGIILPDGSEVDVELGADFQVLRTGAPERD
jgi:uncharacterized membrane protein YkoI